MWIFKHSLEDQGYTHCTKDIFATMNYKCEKINNNSEHLPMVFCIF